MQNNKDSDRQKLEDQLDKGRDALKTISNKCTGCGCVVTFIVLFFLIALGLL